MKLIPLSALATLSLGALVGCINERVYVDPNAGNAFNGGGVEYSGANADLGIQNARVRGDIGPVRQFDGEAQVSGYDDPDFGTSNITLNTQNGEGTGLVMIYLGNSLRDMPAGRYDVSSSNDFGDTEYVQLCSDSFSGIHFDGIAEDATITITDRDSGVRDVEVEATITEGFDGASYGGAEPTVVNSTFSLR